MPRNVRIAACSVEYSPHVSARPRALNLVEQAGTMGADIVCLPEFSAAPVVDSKFVSESVPGPATEAFGALAERHKMYVIIPLLEKTTDEKQYNTAVVIDRTGQIIGQYRKTHLCLPLCHEGETTLAGD